MKTQFRIGAADHTPEHRAKGAQYMVSAQWETPFQGSSGMDGQFVTIEEASQFIIAWEFDTAEIMFDSAQGFLVEIDGKRVWHFPELNQFVPLEEVVS